MNEIQITEAILEALKNKTIEGVEIVDPITPDGGSLIIRIEDGFRLYVDAPTLYKEVAAMREP